MSKSFMDLGPVRDFITPPRTTPQPQDMETVQNTAAMSEPAPNTPDVTAPILPSPLAPGIETGKQVEKHPTGKPDRELKQKRLNLLIQPSVHENLSKIAYVKRLSINELICQVLRDYQDRETAALERYERIIQG